MKEIKSLEKRLAAIEERLDRIESLSLHPKKSETPVTSTVAPAKEAGDDLLSEKSRFVSLVAMVGRTLIILGGAFLIRFVTEAKYIPDDIGTLVGIGYATLWILIANRSSRTGDHWSATFFGITSALITLPLFWEVTARFKTLSSQSSALLLGSYTAVALIVAGLQSMKGLALVVAVPTAALLMILGFATQNVSPYLFTLLGLSFATVLLGRYRKWILLPSLVAVITHFMLMILVIAKLVRPDAETVASLGAETISYSLLFFLLIYLGTSFDRVLRIGQSFSIIEVIQSGTVSLLGVGSLILFVHFAQAPRMIPGIFSLLVSCGAYFAAYRRSRGREEMKLTFISLSALSASYLAITFYFLLEGSLRAILFALAALTATLIGARLTRISFAIQGGFFFTLAALFSGLWRITLTIFYGSTLSLTEWLRPAVVITMLVGIASCFVESKREKGEIGERRIKSANLPSLFTVVLGAGAFFITLILVGYGLAVEEGAIGPSILRTAVIAGSALGLAALGKTRSFSQARWLIVPFLLLGGVKLIFQDLPAGRPAVLFVSLALYGIVLIAAPRILRKKC